MKIREKIVNDLDIPLSLIEDALKCPHKQVRNFPIKKKNGKFRFISHPSAKLKTIQYWLIENLFKKIKVHSVAYAYKDGISILDNAEQHKNNDYFLKVDLKDFFPSIRHTDLFAVVKKWYKNNPQQWELDKNSLELIKLTCFDKNNRLPIGFPSSPFICNIVMFDFDSALIKSFKAEKGLEKVTYTRYADDLFFSFKKRQSAKRILEIVKKCIQDSKSPNIEINPKKIKFGTKKSGATLITGLRLCKDGKITIHRKQKDHIRLLLSLFKKKQALETKELQSLLGHLSFLQHNDPSFFSRIHNKYFLEIKKIKEYLVLQKSQN